MLTNILYPVVHRKSYGLSRLPWLKVAMLHSLGTVLSAAAVGGSLGVLAWGVGRLAPQPSRWAYWSAIFVALLYLPRQLGWTRFPPFLQSTRQVPRRWAYSYPRWAAAFLFGLGLGSGLYTRIVVPTFYLLFVWPFLTAGFLWPAVIWSMYGLARSLHVWWLAWTAPLEDPLLHAHRLTFTLIDKASWMHRANVVLLVVIVVWLAVWEALV